MQNRHIESLLFLAKIFVSAVAVVVGAGILFGDIFSWSNNDYWGHFYSFLSAFALWFGVGAFITPSIKNIAKFLLITHALTTIVAWSLSGQELGIAIFLVSVDLALFYLNLKFNLRALARNKK